MITAVRRKRDGLLADIQIVSMTIPEPRIKNAQAEHGGRKSDWEVVEIDEGLWTDYNPRSKQYLNMDENGVAVLTQTEPEPVIEEESVDMAAKIQTLEEKIDRLEALIEASIRG